MRSLGPDGCEAIALALPENSTLKSLHMDSNNIGDNGATGASPLQFNRCSQFLCLLQRWPACSRAIAPSCRSICTPTLSLMRTYRAASFLSPRASLTPLSSGAEAIALAIKSNSAITHLDLGENTISENILKDIEKHVTENKAKHAGDNVIQAPMPKAIVPSKFVAEPVLAASSAAPAAAAAAAPAVDLDDYVPMEEFDKCVRCQDSVRSEG